MNVLGISGRFRDAAAALSVDGRLASAAAEDSFARVPGIGYDQTGGFPHAAVKACLSIAGLEAGDIHEVVFVQEDESRDRPSLGRHEGESRTGAGRPFEFDRARVRSIDPSQADAIQVALSAPEATTVVVSGTYPPVLATFTRGQSDTPGERLDVPGAAALVDAARSLARVLGVDVRDPLASLDRLGLGAEPEFQAEIGTALHWRGLASGLTADSAALASVTRRVAGDHTAGLADAASLNIHTQRMRRTVAASFTAQLAGAVAGMAEDVGAGSGSGRIGVGGDMFGNACFNTELTRLTGRALSYAVVPESFGRALGAVGATLNPARASLALGPTFSEEDIKRTLDNCRLDYVYEPEWKRLLARVSRMLAQGKVVGWFQDAMAFGPRAVGTRSILCDPSNRYARQNMNEYLRQAPIDEPLPLALAPSAANGCLAAGEAPPAVCDVEVRQEWRQSLSAALDGRHRARLHPTTFDAAPRFRDLLEAHHASNATPGLITINLAGPGEPVACTPRDAVRTVYSSAIDALVIGRFLLMKDYWLLRSKE